MWIQTVMNLSTDSLFEAAKSVPASEARPLRLLVVDDDASSLELVSRCLSNAGYTVNAAADGEEAWARLRAKAYDLLLTDHVMPGLSGLELVARLRASGMTLPVIIDSASPDMREVSDYPDLALAAVLRKPLDVTEIREAVARVLPLRP